MRDLRTLLILAVILAGTETSAQNTDEFSHTVSVISALASPNLQNKTRGKTAP